MNSEPRLAKSAVAHILDRLIEEELRLVSAYNFLMTKLTSELAAPLETIQRHHTQAVAKLHETVHSYGVLPSRLPSQDPTKQRHLKLVARDTPDCLPELIWLETELLREYRKARQIILSEQERQQILDPAIAAMEGHLQTLKTMQRPPTNPPRP